MQNNTICLFDNIKRHPSVIQISSKPCLLQLKENTQLYTVFNHTSKSFLIHFPNKLISCLFLFSQPLLSVLLSVTVYLSAVFFLSSTNIIILSMILYLLPCPTSFPPNHTIPLLQMFMYLIRTIFSLTHISLWNVRDACSRTKPKM